MVKQTVVHLFRGILLSNKEQATDTGTPRVALRGLHSVEESQSQEPSHCMIPFTYTLEITKLHNCRRDE